MNAINGAILGWVVFAVCYCVPMYVDRLALKFYFTIGEFHFIPPDPKLVRLKFITVAAVAALIGLAGMLLGRRLPPRLTGLVHVLGWLAVFGATAVMIYRELKWFQ